MHWHTVQYLVGPGFRDIHNEVTWLRSILQEYCQLAQLVTAVGLSQGAFLTF
jgi:hypothetical protein